jgi:hypothetical protein
MPEMLDVDNNRTLKSDNMYHLQRFRGVESDRKMINSESIRIRKDSRGLFEGIMLLT